MAWGRKKSRHQSTVNIWKHSEDGLGDIEFTWKDGGTPASKFDRIAHSGRSELLMVSLVAETQRIKQIRAVLAPNPKGKAGNQVSITAAGIKTNIPGREEWYANTPARLNPSAEGYLCYTQKLDFGLAHALFVTKAPGFMLVMSEEALWRELKSDRFTTPVLREWVQYIDQQLRDANRLEDAHVYNCRCGILSATGNKLDEIVIEGLKSGLITIPTEEQKPEVHVA